MACTGCKTTRPPTPGNRWAARFWPANQPFPPGAPWLGARVSRAEWLRQTADIPEDVERRAMANVGFGISILRFISDAPWREDEEETQPKDDDPRTPKRGGGPQPGPGSGTDRPGGRTGGGSDDDGDGGDQDPGEEGGDGSEPDDEDDPTPEDRWQQFFDSCRTTCIFMLGQPEGACNDLCATAADGVLEEMDSEDSEDSGDSGESDEPDPDEPTPTFPETNPGPEA